jgi:hypothetical protein
VCAERGVLFLPGCVAEGGGFGFVDFEEEPAVLCGVPLEVEKTLSPPSLPCLAVFVARPTESATVSQCIATTVLDWSDVVCYLADSLLAWVSAVGIHTEPVPSLYRLCPASVLRCVVVRSGALRLLVLATAPT